MTAHNINISELIRVLTVLQKNGYSLMNLDMLPDEKHPDMNKLIVHPVKDQNTAEYKDGLKPSKKGIETRNPDISRDNNDIFNQQDFFGL